jgi:signal transduction histidine kinase
VTGIIDDVLALVSEEFERQQISVLNAIRGELPRVMAERVQLQQLFVNLFMNAIDAMKSVTDRTRVFTIKARLGESGFGESDSVVIMLEDTGVGIDPGHQDRIFDAFFTTKSDGMGMGLSISRSIIEAHGGRLSAKPRDPNGSIFEIVLPALAR